MKKMNFLAKALVAGCVLVACLNAEDVNANEQVNQGETLFNDKLNKSNKNVLNNYVQNNFGNGNGGNDNSSQEELSNANNHPRVYDQTMNAEAPASLEDLDKEQLELIKSSVRNQDLKAIQQTFSNKKYTGKENTKNLLFEMDKTQKIRTRFAMATTLIFETDIESYILGDNTGFKVEEIPNLSNAIAVKPLLIGIDTSLTVFTKDNRLHTFYLYSTDYKSKSNPDLIVYIKDDESKSGDEFKQSEFEKEFLIIKEGIAEVKVRRSEIHREYKQKAKKENEWLMAEEIFNDNQFTFFKYDKEKMPQIPSIFVVIDKQDTPIETRVIGNYIIAETTAKNFTIILGESYVCVERQDTPTDSKANKK